MKGYWLNTEKVVYPDLEKLCRSLRYCPYGQLVEEFPHYLQHGYHSEYSDKLACLEKNGALGQFGHDCPVHYHAEALFVDRKTGKSIIPGSVVQ